MSSPECTLPSWDIFALIGSPPPAAHRPFLALCITVHLQVTTTAGGTIPFFGGP